MPSAVNMGDTRVAWTPGPWGCTTRQGSWDWVVFSEADPNIEVCQMFHDGTDLNERGEANARLIASAPELYEALVAANNRLLVKGMIGDPHDDAALARAKAALAKARGE